MLRRDSRELKKLAETSHAISNPKFDTDFDRVEYITRSGI